MRDSIRSMPPPNFCGTYLRCLVLFEQSVSLRELAAISYLQARMDLIIALAMVNLCKLQLSAEFQPPNLRLLLWRSTQTMCWVLVPIARCAKPIVGSCPALPSYFVTP